MEIVTDTSSIIAVILNEPAKPALIELTQGGNFIVPPSIPWEIGNSLSAIVFQINNLAKNLQGLPNLEGFGLKDFSGILYVQT